MFFRFLVISCIFYISLAACKKTKKDGDAFPSMQETFTGYMLDGSANTCTTIRNNCEKNLTLEQIEFEKNCNAQGFAMVNCNCSYILCGSNININKNSMNAQAAQGKPIHVGYDILGKKNSCTKFDLTKAFCTAEFTEEDEFANKCRDKGFTPFACGCHKFLCSEPITE